MAASLILRNLWVFTTLLEVVLLFYLVRRKLHRSHALFTIYIVAAILQSALVAASYHYYGEKSLTSYYVAWGSQAVMICVRWLAVMEIAGKTLGAYSGLWALAIRILFVVAFFVLVYSIAASGNRLHLFVLTADRSAELCIAACIVCMFLFIRYYRVPVSDLERMLAIGFCLYSCFFVINDSLYEAWRRPAGSLWNYLDMVTFSATLFLWINAARNYSEAPVSEATPAVSPEIYHELSQKLNSRLHLLNSRLNHLFRSEDSRP
jgi:hypothetical protein